jgi:23S rRNA (pseudouridine1915-N3)-methyltransferase
MKFLIHAVGHRMPGWVSAGFEEYARRMPRESPLVLKEVRPETLGAGHGGPGAMERVRRIEGERLRGGLPAGCLVVALDERGQAHSTEAFARLISGWAHEGRDPAFLIGGAEGLDPALKQSAHLMLSLSAMTLPHQLVRVILAEQLYRAVSLLRNHPYHRA